jgi:hypothetical protein
MPGVSALAIEAAGPAPGIGILPNELGEVIFHAPGADDRQVYIVGHSHRSARTGANGSHTVRSQAEVYRIGEWLIQRENVRLLLPEGFFRRRPEATPVRAAVGAEGVAKGNGLDNQALVARLSDTSVFVNADMLLNSNFHIRLQQVENEEVYQSISEFLRRMDESSTMGMPAIMEMELDYLQEIRSAAMLQNVPEAIEKEFRQGTIRIDIKAPSPKHDDIAMILKLAEAGYGVTVILPRSLVDDHEVLRLANLNQL